MIADEHLTKDTQSPFLPGTNQQFAFDSTSLGLLKTCPRLYYYTMIEGYSPRGESIHLRFGIEFHQALQEYDIAKATGADHNDAMRVAVDNLIARTEDWFPEGNEKALKYKNKETLLQLTIDYLDHFEEDTATTYIREDGKPAVELSFRFELEWGPSTAYATLIEHEGEVGHADFSRSQPYLLSGHLDRVVSFNDSLFVLDHKTTTTTVSDYYFRQYEPNNQMTLYTLAGKIMLHAPIRGVIIDACQILLDKPNRFVRGWTYRTDDQLEEWLEDLKVLLALNEQYAAANHWPMNDTACDKFGGCRFREVCSKSPQVREKFLRADFDKLDEATKWNPLKSR